MHRSDAASDKGLHLLFVSSSMEKVRLPGLFAIWSPMRLKEKNCYKVLKWVNLAANDTINRKFMFVCLFGLRLYVRVNNFSVIGDLCF